MGGWITLAPAVAAVAFSLLLTPALVSGQEEEQRLESVDTEAIEEARLHFEEAVRRFHEGDLEVALAEFTTSFRLNPLPQVLFNVAVTQHELDRDGQALLTLRRYLEIAEGEPQQRTQLARELAEELERSLTIVSLTGRPTGAMVFLDGELVGRAPLEAPLRVTAGQHHLELRLDDFAPHRQTLDLQPGQAVDLEIELEHARSWYQRWWIWTLVGVALAGAALGIGLGVTANPAGTDFQVVLERGGGP